MIARVLTTVILLTHLSIVSSIPVTELEPLEVVGIEPPEALHRDLFNATDLNQRRHHPIHCRTGSRIFTLRGAGSPLHTGAIAAMGREIATFEPDSFAGNLPYPAPKDNREYEWSMGVGEEMLSHKIRRYVDHCPHGKIIILGFSEGAQVVGNVLIGPSGTTGKGLGEKYRKSIAAVIMLGDPAFVPHMPFDVGSAQTPGTHQRDNAHMYEMHGYREKLRSYCNAGDWVCASGLDSIVHQTYFTVYRAAIYAFIKDRQHNWKG